MKTLDILTFEEWVANSICVSTRGGSVKVISLQASKIFLDIRQVFVEVKNDSIVKNLERGRNSSYLKEIYQKHYDWIQDQHQKWLSKQK